MSDNRLLTLAPIVLLGVAAFMSPVQGADSKSPDDRAKAFIKSHEKKVKPLEITANRAWWTANISGKDEAFKAKEEAQNRYDEALSDPKTFAELKAIKEAGVKDPVLKREIDVLYLQYMEKQVDPELLKKMTAKANAIEKQFNNYRAKVGGKEMTDSEVRKVLKESKDSKQRQEVWEASKVVGAQVEKELKELVALRNEAATKLGFKDYHKMQLFLAEQDQDQILKLFDDLDQLTREPFGAVKKEIDEVLTKMYGVKAEELRPWHYHDPFFQEPPSVTSYDLDKAYEKVKIEDLCKKYYKGIGLPIDDVLRRSSLYEQKGKSPHAFATDIDRAGDVRVLANIVPNEYWMGTMLHELGHSCYSSKFIPKSVPYVLRTQAHIFTTEGIAMMMEKCSKSADWLTAMGVKVDDPKSFNEAGAKLRRFEILVFSRWCQVMFRFEKEMYANPGQDLNKLWYDLVEKYQQLKRPDGRNLPDYGAKIHIVSAPAYYHNYMLGNMFASQLHHTIAREVLKCEPDKAIYVGKKEVGAYLKEKVFAPGATKPWNELAKFATGEELNPKALAADFAAK